MDLIQWDERYSVGVEEVDRQHQVLFKLVNTCIHSCGDHPDKKDVRKILEEMIDYLDYHFKTEEKYLKKHPLYAEHHGQHVEFVRKTLELQREFVSRGEGVQQDIATYLVNWLKHHILVTDIRFFREAADL